MDNSDIFEFFDILDSCLIFILLFILLEIDDPFDTY